MDHESVAISHSIQAAQASASVEEIIEDLINRLFFAETSTVRQKNVYY